MDDLWDEMCVRIAEVVMAGLKGCNEPEIYLRVKGELLGFVQALEVSLGLCYVVDIPPVLIH